MAKKLYNSLIDYLVVAGCDHDTGLSFSNNESKILANSDYNNNQQQQQDFDKIFEKSFEPSVLAVINHDTAHYPKSSTKFNSNYPPFNLNRNLMANVVHVESDANLKRQYSRRVSVKPYDTPKSPIQSDILQNLPQFCFPTNMYIRKEMREPSVHTFVLTDLSAKKTYATVLTYYREFYCCESSNADTNQRETANETDFVMNYELIHIDDEEKTEAHRNYFFICVPTCIVLISKFPYFSILKDCVSSIYDELAQDPNNFQSILELYAFNLTHWVVSPKPIKPFSLSLEYSLPAKTITINPQDEYEYEVFDFNLSFLFTRFSVSNIVNIILAILSESRILFISEHNGLLTPIIQSFLKLIQPFKWELTNVPLLPCSQLEFVESFQPFIMGYNSLHVSQIDQSNGLIVVNIDENKILWPDDCELQRFPENEVKFLNTSLAKLDFNLVQTRKLLLPSKKDLKTSEQLEREVNQELNSQICNIFLEFFVRLFGDVLPYIKLQTRNFNKKAYLELFHTHLPFYEKVCGTSIFQLFIDNLIRNLNEKKPNLYVDMLAKIKDQSLMQDNKNLSNSSKRSRAMTSLISKPVQKTLKMPCSFDKPFNSSEIIELFTSEFEEAAYLLYKDSLLFLRGLHYLMINNLAEGFKDFYSIGSDNLFPKSLIVDEIYPNLTSAQKDIVKSNKFYFESPEYRRLDEEHYDELMCSISSMDINDDPIDFINLKTFVQKIDDLEIRIDLNSVERLFMALTLEQPELDVETFEIFIDTYQSKEEELHKINKYLPKRVLRSVEYAIKISKQILVPGYGIGIVVLTQLGLYFIEQGLNTLKLLIQINKINSVTKTNYKSNLLVSRPALKITSIDDSDDVYLCVKNEIHIWFVLLIEILNATKISAEMSDKSLIQYAAKNILLADALLISGLNPRSTHSQDLDLSVSYLLYFTQLKDSQDYSPSANDQIQFSKFNPSSREVECQSIEAIICVYIENSPTIWCAIGNRIRIFDAINLYEQSNNLKINERITCLLHDAKNEKVWVGTLEKKIYIIDSQNRIFNKKIEVHTDVIVSITTGKLNRIFTASSNNQIFVWDAEKFESIRSFYGNANIDRKILISFFQSKNYFILCTSRHIEIMDDEFNNIKKLEFLTTRQIEINNDNSMGKLEFGTADQSKITSETITCACISHDSKTDQELLWVGNSKNGLIYIWSLEDFEIKMRVAIDECSGLRVLMFMEDMIWCGSKDGKLTGIDIESFENENSIEAHQDSIRSLCYIKNLRFVVSGSGSQDGTIAVWKLANLTKKSILSSIEKFTTNRQNIVK